MNEHQRRKYELTKDVDPITLQIFRAYHAANPEIFELFKRFANEIAATGRRRYGAKGIMERVRWEVSLTKKGAFKVNNNFTALYARMLIYFDPRFEKFFERRKIRGLKHAA